MSNNKLKPVAAALGTTFVVSLAASPMVSAAENPFNATELSNGGYMVAEGNCGGNKDMGMKDKEGNCGENKKAEGNCGEKKKAEGNCGENKKAEGNCGEDKKMGMKDKEGNCGENKKMEMKKDKEGKCGESKCGANK